MAEDEDSSKTSWPLKGVILCCTSIPPEERTALASRAAEMGASNKLDLTSDTTHMIVGDLNTAKYRYVAKQRPDVKVMAVEWIEAVRQSWMSGEDTDVEGLEREYRLPSLWNLKICVTGFEDLNERAQIADLIGQNGAVYHRDLTKEVTHLVTHPNGIESNKSKYAAAWSIKIVAKEWLLESIQRGMILDESLYHPRIPTEERGNGAWIRELPVSTTPRKRQRDSDPQKDVHDMTKRKLRRTASMKLGSQHDTLWGEIMGADNAVKTESTSMLENSPKDQPDQQRGDKAINIEHAHDISDSRMHPHDKSTNEQQPSRQPNPPSGIFGGRGFVLYGFDDRKISILRGFLSAEGAEMVDSIEELSSSTLQNYMIIPHDQYKKGDVSTLCGGNTTVVTELWVERCLHTKSFQAPLTHIANNPFEQYPLRGFEDLKICSTGFGGIDLLHVSKLVKLMGASYEEYLSPDISVLICNHSVAAKDKLLGAAQWGVPIVSSQWLWDSIIQGRTNSFEKYPFPGAKKLIKSAINEETSKASKYEIKDKSLPERPRTRGKGTEWTPEPEDSSRKRSQRGESKPKRISGKDQLGDGFRDETPLQNLPTEVNAPKRSSSYPSKDVTPTDPDISKEPPQPLPSKENTAEPVSDLGSDIAALLAQQQASKLRPVDAPAPAPLRRRQLVGRATARPATGSGSVSRASSVDTEGTGSYTIEPDIAQGPMSQKVLYEDPEAKAHREKVFRKMSGEKGAALSEKPARKEVGPGIITDVGPRARQTRRAAAASSR